MLVVGLNNAAFPSTVYYRRVDTKRQIQIRPHFLPCFRVCDRGCEAAKALYVSSQVGLLHSQRDEFTRIVSSITFEDSFSFAPQMLVWKKRGKNSINKYFYSFSAGFLYSVSSFFMSNLKWTLVWENRWHFHLHGSPHIWMHPLHYKYCSNSRSAIGTHFYVALSFAYKTIFFVSKNRIFAVYCVRFCSATFHFIVQNIGNHRRHIFFVSFLASTIFTNTIFFVEKKKRNNIVYSGGICFASEVRWLGS